MLQFNLENEEKLKNWRLFKDLSIKELESVYNVNVLLANFRFSFRIKQILI
jgi:hypothetical protein